MPRDANSQARAAANVDELAANLAKLVTKKGPQLAEVAEAFYAEFGGPKGIAAHLRHEFADAPEGGITRQRILGLLCTVIQAHARIMGEDAAAEQMTDEEIQHEITSILAPYQEVHEAGPAPQTDRQAAQEPVG